MNRAKFLRARRAPEIAFALYYCVLKYVIFRVTANKFWYLISRIMPRILIVIVALHDFRWCTLCSHHHIFVCGGSTRRCLANSGVPAPCCELFTS